MLVLGILLIAIAAAIFVAMLFTGSAGIELSVGFVTLGEVSPFVIYLIGAGSVVLFVMGLEMTRSGTARKMRRRREVKELQKENKKLGKERDAAVAETGTAPAAAPAAQPAAAQPTTQAPPPQAPPAQPPASGRPAGEDTGPLR
ncbi:hypothetical protein GCM10027425_27850 [Alteromonas gracilis]